MAGILGMAQIDGVATGTSKKTLLQLVAASNHRVKVSEWGISFNGTSTTAAPIEVEIARQSDAGTATSLTLQKIDADGDETLQTTGQHTATSEPTESAVIRREYVHPQAGYTWQAPFGQEIVINGGDRLAIVVTAGASVSAQAHFVFEE